MNPLPEHTLEGLFAPNKERALAENRNLRDQLEADLASFAKLHKLNQNDVDEVCFIVRRKWQIEERIAWLKGSETT